MAKKNKKKNQAEEASQGPALAKLAQDIMPLETIEGCFLRTTDGRSLLYVSIEGTNDSLYTYQQKLELSDALRHAITSINRPASIIKVPRTIDSNMQLVHIDREIAELRQEIREMGRSARDDHPKAIRLKLLEERLRPRAEKEATSGNRIIHPTYVALEGKRKEADKTLMRDARIFVDRIRETERNAHICEFNEVVELLQLYFTPRHVGASAVNGNMPVVTKQDKKKGVLSRLFGKRRKDDGAKAARDALIRNAVTPSLAEHPNMVELEDQYASVIYFVDFKADNDVGWLDPVLSEKDMPVCIRMEPASVSAIKEGVDMHTRSAREGLLSKRKTASQTDDLLREERHGLEILQIMGDQNEKFFMVSIMAVVRSDSPEQLTADLAYLRSSVESDGMMFKCINWNHLTGLMAASPLRCADIDGMAQTVRPFPASTIAHSLFIKESGLDDGVGLTLGQDDSEGMVRANIVERGESRHNSNIVILGGSGSGKSTLGKTLVELEFLMYGSRVLIIDMEGEFTDLVRANGGDVVRIGSNSSTKISPLQPRALAVSESDREDAFGTEADDSGDVADELVLLSTLPYAKKFIKLAFGIKEEHLDLLELGLEHAYGKFGIGRDTTFSDWQEAGGGYPVPEDLFHSLIELAGMPKYATYAAALNEMAMAVRSAAVGIHSSVWNSRSNLSLDSDIVSFNLVDMEDDDRMKAAWYYNILTFIWSECRMAPATGKPIRVVIDEAHNVVNPRFPDVADDVKSLVKRIRKRGGGTTIITQEVNDFLNPRIKLQGSAILNNATYKFIGQAEAENIQELAKLYGMPHELVRRIEKARKGNFALFAGTQDRTWLKVIVEDWMMKMFGKGGGQ